MYQECKYSPSQRKEESKFKPNNKWTAHGIVSSLGITFRLEYLISSSKSYRRVVYKPFEVAIGQLHWSFRKFLCRIQEEQTLTSGFGLAQGTLVRRWRWSLMLFQISFLHLSFLPPVFLFSSPSPYPDRFSYTVFESGRLRFAIQC